jgi:hypothetical protein
LLWRGRPHFLWSTFPFFKRKNLPFQDPVERTSQSIDAYFAILVVVDPSMLEKSTEVHVHQFSPAETTNRMFEKTLEDLNITGI